uniref:Uncharacterized protein n=1 Tax=Physcomitrium patens TaxID=3218 RepID=A0A2K1JLW8_PHYPA|nr:hypothetical protein PHYPA_017368 [Physcomitrium patens]
MSIPVKEPGGRQQSEDEHIQREALKISCIEGINQLWSGPMCGTQTFLSFGNGIQLQVELATALFDSSHAT